jgi:hypothetical protein
VKPVFCDNAVLCPEPDSNRHGPFRVLGILMLAKLFSSNTQEATNRNITGWLGLVLCLLLPFARFFRHRMGTRTVTSQLVMDPHGITNLV